jgi:hypothetical protein
VPVAWDDPVVDWRVFDGVLVRSCWDYHLRPAAFLDWIARLDAAGIPLWNPSDILRWNANKIYLRDLAARGVSIVETRWIDAGSTTPLVDLLTSARWDRAIVKPAISASAWETWQTTRARAVEDEDRFRALSSTTQVMIQPFVDAIVDSGEWSIMFFGGVFSHAILKRPRSGDYRVQSEFGGSADRLDPGASLIAQARAVLDACPFDPATLAYARVDGVVVDDRFVLMELELLEPFLFLAAERGSAERCASAVMERLAAEQQRA